MKVESVLYHVQDWGLFTGKLPAIISETVFGDLKRKYEEQERNLRE
jgi:hypothetical protein